jgi:hypothetical protein
VKLNDNCDKIIVQLEYVNVIGSFMYVIHCIRTYITFSVCKLSKYTSKSNANYWKIIARVSSYLKRIINLDLFYFGFPVVLEGYCDVSWITSLSDNKSTS